MCGLGFNGSPDKIKKDLKRGGSSGRWISKYKTMKTKYEKLVKVLIENNKIRQEYIPTQKVQWNQKRQHFEPVRK